MGDTESFESQREEMVARQIAARGVRSPAVLDAMRKVRREGFVPSYLGEFAYDDAPLPIEEEQTISQPFIVALMVEALAIEGHERVLEIGTGSGYAAAVLAEIAREYAMFMAYAASLRSAELGRQVGAVILSQQGEFISVGANEVPCGGGGLYWSDDAHDGRERKRQTGPANRDHRVVRFRRSCQ